MWVTIKAQPKLARGNVLKLSCNLEPKIPVDEPFKLYPHVRMRIKKAKYLVNALERAWGTPGTLGPHFEYC